MKKIIYKALTLLSTDLGKHIRLAKIYLREGKREKGVGELRTYVSKLNNPHPGLVSMVDSYFTDHAIRDRDIATFEHRVKIYAYLQKNLSKAQASASKYRRTNSFNPRYYDFWQQGMDEAPPIVRSCLKQLQFVVPRANLDILDAEGLTKLLSLPKSVQENAGQFRAHLSDIIRVGLLALHGGVWVDATTWLNEDPSKFLENVTKNSGFFAFRYSKTRVSSWLLASHAGNYVPSLLYEVLCDYWSENKELIGYFMFHDLLECLYFADETFRSIVDTTDFVDANPPHIIQREQLFSPFNLEAFDSVLVSHPIQKLTYKFGKRNTGPGTTFDHIVSLLTP